MTPLSFSVGGDTCLGWTTKGTSEAGLLLVPGGRQTRVGPHRLFVRLAQAAARAGHSTCRFDRRGLGDSDGAPRDFTETTADIAAASAAFRAACPAMKTVFALGLCDGAAALLLAEARIDRLILLNPWIIEEGAAFSGAAASAHYKRRLFQAESWKRLATGRLNPFPAVGNLFRIPRSRPEPLSALSSLVGRIAAAYAAAEGQPLTILSDRDRTADEFRAAMPRSVASETLPGDHGFSRPEDYARLEQRVLEALSGAPRSRG
ncbi:MAG: hydrolase 1, exosortase A system-associated [Pacificimonas sp.]|nr:hydrolase 1, exosortase A system-associated [Pacificimonas sp.]